MRRLLQALISLAASPLVVVFAAAGWLRGRLRPTSDPSPRLLLSLSQVMWDEVWQRPQEFAWQSAHALPVIYCSPVQMHRWLFTLRSRWAALRVLQQGKVLIISPLVFSGHYKNELIFRLNCWIIALYLRPWLRKYQQIHCVSNTPYAEPILERLFWRKGQRSPVLTSLGYDVIDDFTAFDWSPAFGKTLDKRLLAKADTIFTGTYELCEQYQAPRPDTEFIACGVDFDLFAKPSSAPPADLADIPTPIIGYFGSISERLDLELLNKLAQTFPKASLVFLGPVHLSEEALPKAPNIHYLGLKTHEALPAYAQHFSVGLIPFRVSEATLKLNPVKTLEYLAAGVRVVSTAIPDVQRFFSDVVSIAETHEQYIAMVGRALEGGNEERRQAGIEMARNASWARMCLRMQELLGIAAPSRAARPAATARSVSSRNESD